MNFTAASNLNRAQLHRKEPLALDDLFKHSDSLLDRGVHQIGSIECGPHHLARGRKTGLAATATGLLFVSQIILPLIFLRLFLMQLIITPLVFPTSLGPPSTVPRSPASASAESPRKNHRSHWPSSRKNRARRRCYCVSSHPGCIGPS